jgi:hypothetical protein
VVEFTHGLGGHRHDGVGVQEKSCSVEFAWLAGQAQALQKSRHSVGLGAGGHH